MDTEEWRKMAQQTADEVNALGADHGPDGYGLTAEDVLGFWTSYQEETEGDA